MQKKKLKVGKGSRPSNATDVSIKVQAIHVPIQQIQKSKETIQEKLNDLYLQLSHLKHHNYTIRSGKCRFILML
jgi:hypothetical protein